MSRIATGVLLSLCLGGSGCAVNLSGLVTLRGSVPSKPLGLAAEEGKEPWAALALDHLGTLRLDNQILSLPSAQEVGRFGVTLIDASALPPVWRPRHAEKGGPMVAALDRASPLALAGLRPFNVIEAIDGNPAGDVHAVIERLAAIAPGTEFRLDLSTPRGKAALRAKAVETLVDTKIFSIPSVFHWIRSSTGFCLGLPLSTGRTFDCWSRVREEVEPMTSGQPWPEYQREFEWQALLAIFKYRSRTNLHTHEVRKRFELFGFKIKEWTSGGGP